jgi:SSS family solute:Na+ symporter
LQHEHKKLFQDKQVLISNFVSSNSEKTSNAIAKADEANDVLRARAKNLIEKAVQLEKVKVEINDVDYVFINFILNNLPRGLIGLLLAVILSAAMSSTSSELNALASTTTIDLYKRNSSYKSEIEMVNISKWFTLGWGLLAIGIACVANLAENLIQLVNIIGSIFYGNVLGIFLLAFFVKNVKGNSVFKAALLTQFIVIGLFLLNEYEYIKLPYLWLNFVGCAIVMTLAVIIQSASNNFQKLQR